MSIDLDAIKARADRVRRGFDTGLTTARDDIPALVAEMERLRAEVALLTGDRDVLRRVVRALPNPLEMARLRDRLGD